MDSTGALNGSPFNSLPLNEGRFTLRASATANIPVPASVQAIRRARLIGTAPVAASAAQCKAVRRRLYGGTAQVSTSFAAQFRRRANGQGTLAVSVVCYAKANARLTASGSCLVSFDGAASLFWKYRMPAPVKRIARAPETTNRVVLPQEARSLTVPASPGAALVSQQKDAAHVASPTRKATAEPDRGRAK